MIRGLHGLFHSPQAEATRDFLRDKLGLPFVDSGGGWLIFGSGPAEIGIHPADAPRHELSFYCDDLDGTMKTLGAKGVAFNKVFEEHWGRGTTFELPGGVEVILYEPKHAQPPGLPAT